MTHHRSRLALPHLAHAHLARPRLAGRGQVFGLASVLVLVASLQARPASAWSATGHRIVAQVAWDAMSEPVRARAVTLAKTVRHQRIQAAAARDQDGDGREVFLEASLWLDQVRASGVGLFDRWHYVNLPIIAAADRDAITPPAPHADNAMWAIATARRALSAPSTAPAQASARSSAASSQAPDAARATALVTLLHVVGDLHQPMHAVSRFDRQHPTGDRGGNDVVVGPPWGNLHRLWDGMAGAYGARATDSEIREWADALRKTHPVARFGARTKLDPTVWATESHQLARDIAYDGLTPGKAPDEPYLERVRDVSRQRLALAGYRLAALLEATLHD